jgi:serine/threonine protein kinase
MVCCVTDFGVSKMMTQEMTKAAGTPMYMSPEILNGGAYAYSADMYSFAFIVWEIFARKLPYGDMIPWEITKKVCDDDMRPEPLMDPMDMVTSRCWDKDPQKRPTFLAMLDYLRRVQAALRNGGETAFREPLREHLSVLDDCDRNVCVTPNHGTMSKLRKLTGMDSLATVSSTSALMTGSPSSPPATLSGSESSPALGGSATSSSSSSKFILNMLPMSRGRRSVSKDKEKDQILSPKSTKTSQTSPTGNHRRSNSSSNNSNSNN